MSSLEFVMAFLMLFPVNVNNAHSTNLHTIRGLHPSSPQSSGCTFGRDDGHDVIQYVHKSEGGETFIKVYALNGGAS
jgi:hypothetical protein